jgi:arylsulfatase A-like enzyme
MPTIPFYRAGQPVEENEYLTDAFTREAVDFIDRRKKYDGVNLMPFLTGADNSRPHDQLFWRIGKRSAVRVGDWKLLRNPGRGRGQSLAWQLYNLAEDISEQNELSKSLPSKADELRKAWEAVNSEMIDPVSNPRG